ncbi:MAG: prolipoprotein diacylglyceryl transferase, partial [Pseudomonadales bacterium]|nr:prolipoprotein diacylglyceryl transferase [Pseudomonadales bacterium]
MWHYPDLDPVAISLGPLRIQWYAVSYLVGVGLTWWTMNIRARKYAKSWNDEQVSDLIFYGVLGVILGGRIGYVLFYNLGELFRDPLMLFRIWEGGMSFHGGMIGVFVAMFVYGRMNGRTFFEISDFVAPSVPLGLGCGRLGNFVNTELPGRVTDIPWAVIFPGEAVGRHPSSLYQFFLEGPLLFAILWWFAAKPRPRMVVSGLFLTCYGALRFFSEFFRQPDVHLGFVAFGWVSMG